MIILGWEKNFTVRFITILNLMFFLFERCDKYHQDHLKYLVNFLL